MSKTLGEMTPGERKAVIGRALGRLQRELDAAAPAIAKILAGDEAGNPVWRCEDCGWICPVNTFIPIEEAECDNCGGELVLS